VTVRRVRVLNKRATLLLVGVCITGCESRRQKAMDRYVAECAVLQGGPAIVDILHGAERLGMTGAQFQQYQADIATYCMNQFDAEHPE
jgi:hypothetical protein